VGVPAEHVPAFDPAPVLVLPGVDDPVHGGGAEGEGAAVRMAVHSIRCTEADGEEGLFVEVPFGLPPAAAGEDVAAVVDLQEIRGRFAVGAAGGDVGGERRADPARVP